MNVTLSTTEESLYHKSDLQLIALNNFILLGHQLGHIPSAIDIPPCKPISFLSYKIDKRVGAQFWSFDKH